MANIKVQIIMLGEPGVGKTAIARRYTDGKYREHQPTLPGIYFSDKTIVVNNRIVKVIVQDTSGEERRRGNITSNYYRNADGCVLVYDPSIEDTFQHLQYWLDTLRDKNDKNIPVAVVAAKSDITTVEKTANVFANTSLECFTCSAKTGEGIDIIFDYLVKQAAEKKLFEEKDEEIVRLNRENEELRKTLDQKKPCC